LTSFKPGQTEKVRVGLIGSGSRGLGLAQTLANVRNIELVACCDIVEDHLKAGLRLADKDAKGYYDYQKLIDDPNVRAVIIATPLFLHFPMAVAALKAGQACICRENDGL
jgi:predicted dehydrogenase